MLRTFLFFVFVLEMLVISVAGQNDSFVCREVQNKISGSIEISKVARQAIYDDECDFDFHSGDEWFTISIKKHKTLKESRETFSEEFHFLTFAETYPEAVQYLKKSNYWNEAKGYSQSDDSDHLIMLRHKNITITLISSKYDLILKVESLLREINLE